LFCFFCLHFHFETSKNFSIIFHFYERHVEIMWMKINKIKSEINKVKNEINNENMKCCLFIMIMFNAEMQHVFYALINFNSNVHSIFNFLITFHVFKFLHTFKKKTALFKLFFDSLQSIIYSLSFFLTLIESYFLYHISFESLLFYLTLIFRFKYLVNVTFNNLLT
jgi:hypothetical protein